MEKVGGVRKDGTRFWVSAVIDPILAPDGKLDRLRESHPRSDGTQNRQRMCSAKGSSSGFSFRASPTTRFTRSLPGSSRNWNAGAERIKGYAPQEIIGQHFSKFTCRGRRGRPAATGPWRRLSVKAALKRKGGAYRKDGSKFWANVVIDAIRTPDGRLVGYRENHAAI